MWGLLSRKRLASYGTLGRHADSTTAASGGSNENLHRSPGEVPLFRGAVVEAQPAIDDVFGDAGERAVVGEGVGAQANQGLADVDAQLGRDHACGLVHDVAEVSTALELGSELAGPRASLHQQHRLGGNSGHHERVGVLVVA